MRRARRRSSTAVPIMVLILGVLAVAGWWIVAQGHDGATRDLAPSDPSSGQASRPAEPPGPDEILGTSWRLIEQWSMLNERCSRLHEHLADVEDAAGSNLAEAEEATWVDLKEAYDAVMRVASTLEKADAGTRDGDAARRQRYVTKARELVERSEALLRRAGERLSAVGY